MVNDYLKMFDILEEYLNNNVDDIDQTILNAIELRKNGHIFSFEEHLKAFIYAQLSALVSWKKICEHKQELDLLFCNFDKDKLKEIAPETLIDGIRKLKCYSPFTTKNQMYSLKENIEILEKIANKYNGIDNFVTQSTPENVVKMLADKNSVYKLRFAAVALVCEYLRNVGIDIIKPDAHIKRISGADRLNLVSSSSDYQIIAEFKKLSEKIGISQVKMDYLLWNYCAKKYGEICAKTPKCDICVIRKYCNR